MTSRFGLLVVFVVVFVGYAVYEASGYLYGPRIYVATLQQVVNDSLITIHGTAVHISSLALNGSEVPVTTDGSFVVPFLLAPGDNRLILDAKDSYGRTRSQTVEVVYIP